MDAIFQQLKETKGQIEKETIQEVRICNLSEKSLLYCLFVCFQVPICELNSQKQDKKQMINASVPVSDMNELLDLFPPLKASDTKVSCAKMKLQYNGKYDFCVRKGWITCE